MTKIKCLNFGGSDCRRYTGPSGEAYEFYKGRFTEVKKAEDALSFLNAAKGTAFEADGVMKKVKDALKKMIKNPKKDEVDENNPPEETGVLEPNTDDLAIDGDEAIDGEGTDKAPAPKTEDDGQSKPEETTEDKAENDAEETVDEIVGADDAPEDAAIDAPEDQLKAECPKCKGKNVHYKDGCQDCGFKEELEIDPEEPHGVKEESEAPVNSDGTPDINVYTEQGLKDLNKKQQDFLIKKVQGEEATIPQYESERVDLLIKLQTEGADLLKLIKDYQA